MTYIIFQHGLYSYNYIKYALDHIGYAEGDDQLRSLLPYNLDQDLLKDFRRL